MTYLQKIMLQLGEFSNLLIRSGVCKWQKLDHIPLDMLDSDQLETKFMLALNLTSTCISSYLDGLNSKYLNISKSELESLLQKSHNLDTELNKVLKSVTITENTKVYLEECIQNIKFFSTAIFNLIKKVTRSTKY